MGVISLQLRKRIEVESIDWNEANEFSKKHHEYMEGGRTTASVRHGIDLDGERNAVISYAYIMGDGVIDGVDTQSLMSVSRLTIKERGIDNFGSCALSKSIGKFKTDYARKNDIEALVTYVVSDWRGTVFEAYGFKECGKTKGKKNNGNRAPRDIYKKDKTRYIFHL